MPYPHYGKWRARWVDEAGKQRSATFPEFKAADYHEKRKKIEVEEIRRGPRRPTPADKTFGELATFWYERRAATKRSARDIKSIIDRHLLPRFGATRVREIGVEDVDEYVAEKLNGLSAKTVANHVTVIVAMFNYAAGLKEPWVAVTPRFKKPKVALFSRDYSFLRTQEEILRFLGSAQAEGNLVHAFYAAVVYTGVRAGELAALQWARLAQGATEA